MCRQVTRSGRLVIVATLGFLALPLGLAKVRGEWSLITLTHNLLKLHRAQLA